jgi:hypothetical protein
MIQCCLLVERQGSEQKRTKSALSARGSPLSVLYMLLRGNQMAVDTVSCEPLSGTKNSRYQGKIQGNLRLEAMDEMTFFNIHGRFRRHIPCAAEFRTGNFCNVSGNHISLIRLIRATRTVYLGLLPRQMFQIKSRVSGPLHTECVVELTKFGRSANKPICGY